MSERSTTRCRHPSTIAGLAALVMLALLAVLELQRGARDSPALSPGAVVQEAPFSETTSLEPLLPAEPGIEERTVSSLQPLSPDARAAVVPGASIPSTLAGVTLAVQRNGQAVERAIVLLNGLGRPLLRRDTVMDEQGRARANERGLASFAIRPMSTWHGRASLPDGSCETRFLFTSPRPGQQRRVEVALEVVLEDEALVTSIEIVVLSLPSGRPLPGAIVRSTPPESSGAVATLARRFVTGRDGRAAMTLTAGSTLQIAATGHTGQTLRLSAMRLARASRMAEKGAPGWKCHSRVQDAFGAPTERTWRELSCAFSAGGPHRRGRRTAHSTERSGSAKDAGSPVRSADWMPRDTGRSVTYRQVSQRRNLRLPCA